MFSLHSEGPFGYSYRIELKILWDSRIGPAQPARSRAKMLGYVCIRKILKNSFGVGCLESHRNFFPPNGIRDSPL